MHGIIIMMMECGSTGRTGLAIKRSTCFTYYRNNRNNLFSMATSKCKMRHVIVLMTAKTVVRIALIVANNIDNLCMHVYGEVHSNVLVLLLLAIDTSVRGVFKLALANASWHISLHLYRVLKEAISSLS